MIAFYRVRYRLVETVDKLSNETEIECEVQTYEEMVALADRFQTEHKGKDKSE